MGPAIDHLFSMCCMQYRYVLQTKMKVDNANGKEVKSKTSSTIDIKRASKSGYLTGDATAAVSHHGAHVLVRPQGAGQTRFLSGNLKFEDVKSKAYALFFGFRFYTTW